MLRILTAAGLALRRVPHRVCRSLPGGALPAGTVGRSSAMLPQRGEELLL